MKTILILILTLFLHLDSFSQDSIEYNFQIGNYDSKSKFTVKNNNSIRLIIRDINRLIYKIEIKSSKKLYSSSNPPNAFTNLIEANTAKTDIKKDSANLSAFDSDKVKKYVLEINKLNKMVIAYNDLLEISKFDNSFDKIRQFKITAISAFSEVTLDDDAIQINAIIENYNKSIGIIKDINNEALVEELNEENKKVIEKLKSEFDKANFEETFKKLIKLYNDINITNFTFTSDPVIADFDEADEIDFEVKISSTDEKYVSKNRDFPVPVFLTGGFTLDFSAGPFMTNVIDYSYISKKDSALVDSTYEQGYQIIPEKETPFGISTFMHYSYKWRNIALGINFGIGLMGNLQTVRYMLGGSLILGKQSRVILNGGLSIGSVARLTPSLNEGTFYGGEIPSTFATSNKTLTGWFGSVSYNF